MKSNTFYILYILWLRQLKRYFRSKSRIIASLGQPLLFLIALGFGLKSTFAAAGNGNYIQFLSPGIIAMSIIFTAIFAGIEVVWERQFGFLKETMVAPVSRFAIMFGRTLGGATVASFQGILVMVLSLLFGFRPALAMILPALAFMILIALVFSALGIAFGSIMEDMQGFPLVMNFVVMPLFFLSGALFPLNSAPTTLKIVAMFNPLTYGVDGLRAVFIGASQFNAWIDAGILAAIAVLFISIGAWLFSRIEV